MSLKISTRLAVLIMLAGISNSALAANVGGAFSRGSTSVGIVVGTGTAFDDDYIVLGIGAGYYLTHGLEIGLDLQRWFSGDPSITKVSPQVRYVFTQPKTIKPYVGAFYRRTYYGDSDEIDVDDLDSFGYRVGAYFSTSNRLSIGAGVVYEEFTDCDRVTDCSTTSPEVHVTFNF